MLVLPHVMENHLESSSALLDVYAVVHIMHTIIYAGRIGGNVRKHGGRQFKFREILIAKIIVGKGVLILFEYTLSQVTALIPAKLQKVIIEDSKINAHKGNTG